MATLRVDTLQTPDSLVTINVSDLQSAASVTAFIANLANSSDLTKGSALVGRATRRADNVTELKTFGGRYDNDLVTLERQSAGYNFGGGPWIWDAAATDTPDDVTIVQATGITTGRWKRLTGSLTASMFGARAVVGFNNSTALAAMETFLRAELAAFRKVPTLEFEAGTYEYNVAPNFGIQGATIVNNGKVKLRYTGTNNAMLLDAGVGVGVNLTGLTFGRGVGFIIEAGPTATLSTVRIRNVYLSDIRIRVWGAGTTQAGFLVEGCVLTNFYIGCTSTESAKEAPADYTNGWYLGGKPAVGMTVTQSAVGAQTSYCNFYDWLGAACVIGMFIDNTLGNLFLGGDNEFNTNLGSVWTANAQLNRVRGMNHEVNTNGDVECAGNFNTFDTDTVLFKFTGGSGNRLVGGTHDQVSVLGGTGNYVGEIVYGRGLSGNLSIADSGTKTAFGWCYQAQSQTWSRGPSLTGSISVGASPFTYTNAGSRPLRIFATGGTTVSIAYKRGVTTFGTIGTGTITEVSPGDQLVVTYVTTPPTMNFVTA